MTYSTYKLSSRINIEIMQIPKRTTNPADICIGKLSISVADLQEKYSIQGIESGSEGLDDNDISRRVHFGGEPWQ